MKKASAISMAAFYLLLITGGYACILSCGSNQLAQLLSHVSVEDHSHETPLKADKDKSEKSCEGDEDCSCCQKHGNYTIKENIKPDTNSQHQAISSLAISKSLESFSLVYSFSPIRYKWPKNHAPPPGTSAPIYIKIHSLLI